MIQSVSRFVMGMFGWTILGDLPKCNKYIIIVGPHTSNWDFILGMLVRNALAAKIRFLGKSQLFVFPIGWFFRAIGGIAVYRSKENNLVDQVVAHYDNYDHFILGLTPEGTRRQVKRWHQGFYHIACKAQVDIVMIGFDYKTKQVRVREPLKPCNDIDHGFPIILDYFRAIDGRFEQEIANHQPKQKAG